MEVERCSGFLNLLHKRFPTIANPTTLTLLIYKWLLLSSTGLRSTVSSCFVICSFKFLSSSFLRWLYSTNLFPCSILRGFSVLLHFLVFAGSQFLFSDSPYNLGSEFFT